MKNIKNDDTKQDTPSPIRRFFRIIALNRYFYQNNKNDLCLNCKPTTSSHYSNKLLNNIKSKSTPSSECNSPALLLNRRIRQSLPNNKNQFNNKINNIGNNFKINNFETKFSNQDNLLVTNNLLNLSKLFNLIFN